MPEPGRGRGHPGLSEERKKGTSNLPPESLQLDRVLQFWVLLLNLVDNDVVPVRGEPISPVAKHAAIV